MKAKEKAQELVQKHYGHGFVLEAALITAKECRDVAQSVPSSLYWNNVIAELEKMKSNQ